MAQPFLTLVDIDARKSLESGSTRATIIAKMVIPPLRFKTTTRTAGGGVLDVDYSQDRLQPIEPAVSVHGFDSDLMPGVKERWTLAAALRNRKTSAMVPVRVEIEGVIVEWSPDEADPGQFNGCNSIFKEVTHFELSIDGKEWWYVDEDERVIRRMGVDITAARRAALGA
ncbi:phage major tail tube protein [Agrobacterium tumefaciens]|uniref:phage major tail tube protein n=1 Tax=Agrobacterium tumefaciens TaxID=358 RepID=UPI0021CF9125|nr:phage major tail tube protein [Agrobacterium tumefaciens]UXS04476.1 hypothetical protein FY156_23730 [Agrobacterium tumefaciens]